MIFIMENVSTYLSASMNMDPLCCRQVPLLLIWFLEILRGCGNPEWYQVPSQLCGNWHCCCGVVKPILINAKHMTVRLSKLSMFSCFPSSSSPEIDSLKASYKKSTSSPALSLSIKVVNQRQVSTSTLYFFYFCTLSSLKKVSQIAQKIKPIKAI